MGIAQPEFDIVPGPARVLGGDPDERLADVEPGDPVGAEPGKLDRQISGTGRNLQDLRAGRQPIGEHARGAAEILDVARGILGVLMRDDAFHADAPIGLCPS